MFKSLRKKLGKEGEGPFRIGDSVRVKPGFLDEEFGTDLSGWQGRVVEIDNKNQTILLAWDSVTLNAMPESFISAVEQNGSGWDEYYLRYGDVEPTKGRDTEADVTEAVERITGKFYWHHLGDEGMEISKILAGTDIDDEFEQMERWAEYLASVLSFPFEAEVTEFQERGPLRSGDVLTVQGIESVEDLYGLIIRVKKGRRTYHFPLCDLTPTDEKSPNYQPVRIYAIWFANR